MSAPDHAELIAELRRNEACNGLSDRAADALSTVVAERDAARGEAERKALFVEFVERQLAPCRRDTITSAELWNIIWHHPVLSDRREAPTPGPKP